ncbi:MAG: sugar transferase [Hespellia sp.]|nr:sugar transferase [Hespellia sp.]
MYKGEKSIWSKHWDFILLDIVFIQISFVIAYMIRHGFYNPYRSDLYRHMCVLIVLFDVLTVFLNNSYKDVVRRGFYLEFIAVVKHVTIVVALSFAYMFLLQSSEEFSRLVFIQFWFVAIFLLYFFRLILKAFVRKKIVTSTYQRSVVVITSKNLADSTINTFLHENYRDYRVTSLIIIDENMIGQKVREVNVQADRQNALQFLSDNVVDEVFVNLPVEMGMPMELINGCEDMGLTIHINLVYASEMTGYTMVEKFGGYTVVTSSVKIASPHQLFLKRFMDICGGIIGLLITGLLFVFVAPIIKIQSPGPVFFSQMRVGRQGRQFKIYKFRSMYMDAEERKKELMNQNEMDGLMFKMKDDPRIFPFGKFIRKTSIDEFPQFLNVLKGDMSLVGTRPPTVDEWAQYEFGHLKRLAAKPGLTGLWQVSGRSKITNFDDVVRLDVKYITTWTLGLDIRILFKTLAVVFRGEGSE